MAWHGPHIELGTPTQQRARRRRREESLNERRERLIAEERCVRCAKPNDRACTLSKNGRLAVVCSTCLNRAASEQKARRETSKRLIMDMERALGMPALGVGGKNIR